MKLGEMLLNVASAVAVGVGWLLVFGLVRLVTRTRRVRRIGGAAPLTYDERQDQARRKARCDP